MKRLRPVLVLALLPVVAIAADPYTRLAYACRLSRSEAVVAAVDACSRSGWEIVDADPAVGTLTARYAHRKAGSLAEVIQVCADGDSLRVLAYSYQYDSSQFLAADEEILAPILSALSSLVSTPAEQRR